MYSLHMQVGWLTKRERSTNSRLQCWCVLLPGRLTCFEDSDAEVSVGSFDLDARSDARRTVAGFVLTSHEGSEVEMIASSKEDQAVSASHPFSSLTHCDVIDRVHGAGVAEQSEGELRCGAKRHHSD